MQHYAPATHDLSSPWRTRTLIASAIAALELLALVGLAIVLLGKGWFQHARADAAANARAAARTTAAQTKAPPPTTPTKTHTAPAKPMLTKARTGVLVLNGNGRNGAAGAEARILRTHGYHVTAVGNAKRNNYALSMVMYRPGYGREAQRLAHELHIPIVSVIDGVLASQLKGAEELLIVGDR